MTFTAVTWNVLFRDRDARIDAIVRALRAIAPDVVLLQEVDDGYAQRLSAAIDMRVATVGSQSKVVPAILTRAQPAASGALRIELEGGATARDYLYADVLLDGRPIRCSTAHLTHTPQAGRMAMAAEYRDAARSTAGARGITDPQLRASVLARLAELEAIERLRGTLPARPEVFGGDLNFVAHGPEYLRILRSGLRDAWTAGPRLGSGATILAQNPLVADQPDAYADELERFPAYGGGVDYVLDYQFFSPELVVGRAWTFGAASAPESWPSDHLGLAVEYSHGA